VESICQRAPAPRQAQNGCRLSAGVALPLSGGLDEAQGAKLADTGQYLLAGMSACRRDIQ
jgi:hypothetical protein